MFHAVEGQTVVVTNAPPLGAPFTDRTGALVDPTTVTVTVLDPAHSSTTYSGGDLTHPSVGVYEVEVTVDLEGIWRVRMEGTVPSDGTAVSEFGFCVDPSLVEVGS